ncbi:hypothetical protein OF83DRAFT_1180873 [Amylostereum chailletii]|nr:hypothetical protein OF83DRAFT_1180873 [Amylostereum chailletii]
MDPHGPAACLGTGQPAGLVPPLTRGSLPNEAHPLRENWPTGFFQRLQLAIILRQTNDTPQIGLKISRSILNSERRAVDSQLRLTNMAEDLDVPPPPVHRIPAELLSGVFRFLPRWEAADSFNNIISVSHTCGRWRAVSLGCGELWATLPLDFGVMWTEAALERSGTFPLSVNISRALDYSYFGYGGPPPKRLDIVRIALAELSRIQELVITIPGDTLRQFPEMSELLRLICSAPATLLEKLKVTAQNMQHIPSNLFTGAIPEQLRSLEVWNIDFDPGVLDNGLRFPHLHHLELVGCRVTQA